MLSFIQSGKKIETLCQCSTPRNFVFLLSKHLVQQYGNPAQYQRLFNFIFKAMIVVISNNTQILS